MLWNYSPTEIQHGFHENHTHYCCIICDSSFEKGRIFETENGLYDAFGAVSQHLSSAHGTMAAHLLNQESSVTGLSEIQKNLISLLLQHKSDKEIGVELGIAPSTVRNHKFRLREKEKQAKVFLALMSLLSEETKASIGKSDNGLLDELHSSATMVDDCYSITEGERKKTLASYMDSTGRLKLFPAKEKKKIIVLREIIKNFKTDIVYTEKEIDRILKRIYEEDYASIRRALIEYGFMDRTADCSAYRTRVQA